MSRRRIGITLNQTDFAKATNFTKEMITAHNIVAQPSPDGDTLHVYEPPENLEFKVPAMGSDFRINEAGYLMHKEESADEFFHFTAADWTCEDTASIYSMAHLLVSMMNAANVQGKWNFEPPHNTIKMMEALVHHIAAEVHKALITDTKASPTDES